MKKALVVELGTRFSSRTGIHYKVVDRLGDGGNSTVYLALDASSENRGVLFALKVFANVADEERLERFLAENEVLRKLSHPAMMKVYDNGLYKCAPPSGEITKYPFIVAEYLPRTMRSAISAGDLSLAEKLACSLQLLSVLQYLASRQPAIIHRDIKPENIFLKGRSCVLGDFGLMKVMTALGDDDRTVIKESTGPGMPKFFRTPDLVAYARRETGLTPASDVFQLGLVLAELFTGHNPLMRCGDFLAPVKLEALRAIAGEAGARIGALIEEMLLPEPDKRKTAAELLDPWEGVFQEAVSRSVALEGRLFKS